MQTRRMFIKNSGGILLSTLLSSSLMAFISTQKKNIGLQIYTVRNELKNDLYGTLKILSDIGYTWLELAGYNDGLFYDKTPSELKKMIADLGMQIISSHANVEVKGVDMGNVEKIADAHAELGVKYVIQPWLTEERRVSADSYKTFAWELNRIGEIMKKNGLQFGYHNHAFEFLNVNEQIAYDLLLSNTERENVIFEMDLYWVIKGGADPVDYFNKYPGRFELFHVKDMEADEDNYFIEVGKGTIDFARIFANAEQAGMKYFFVEQDKCKNHKPLESIKISFEYLNKANFIKS